MAIGDQDHGCIAVPVARSLAGSVLEAIDLLLPVVEPLPISDKCTLEMEKLADGKFTGTPTPFVSNKVILRAQVLGIRSVDGTNSQLRAKSATPTRAIPAGAERLRSL